MHRDKGFKSQISCGNYMCLSLYWMRCAVQVHD
uniref:Uncharacterized protein n=1 Tax=Arundo donax TaxID=35708 RepID=A0A0A8ZKF8_ARUDO